MPFGFGKGRLRSKFGKGARWGRSRRGFESGGPPTSCICPECGMVLPHQPGIPCFQTKCPQCDSPMTRRFVVEE
jgi:hypothetical protein